MRISVESGSLWKLDRIMLKLWLLAVIALLCQVSCLGSFPSIWIYWMNVFDKIKNASDNFCEAWSEDNLCQTVSLGSPDVSTDTRITFVKGNTSTLVRQKVVFAYCSASQWSNDNQFSHILIKESWVHIPSLVSTHQSMAEIFPHFLFGAIATKFDSLYQTNDFENQKYEPTSPLVKTGQIQNPIWWEIQYGANWH